MKAGGAPKPFLLLGGERLHYLSLLSLGSPFEEKLKEFHQKKKKKRKSTEAGKIGKQPRCIIFAKSL